MDKCSLCGQQLFVGKRKSRTELNSLAVYIDLPLVCVNPKCKNFGGKDLANPLKVAFVKTIPDNDYADEEMRVK